MEKIESSFEYVELKAAGENVTFQLRTDKSAALPLKTMLVKDDYMTKFITENELCLSLGSTTSAVNVIQIYDELVIVVELKRNCR